MFINLSEENSLLLQFISEIRDADLQRDSMRFRRNLERIGEIAAYEVSKLLTWEKTEVVTPLGTAHSAKLHQQPVLATVLRAGLPFHQGLLNYFDKADNAFISAYRRNKKDGSFEILLEYMVSPDIEDRTLILIDPMLASGSSIHGALETMLEEGTPEQIFIVSAIASREGLEYVESHFPQAHLVVGAIDEELTAKGYIVPGLGDAGDLAFGHKVQN
jgi:uracil phosphoribosyltransferase